MVRLQLLLAHTHMQAFSEFERVALTPWSTTARTYRWLWSFVPIPKERESPRVLHDKRRKIITLVVRWRAIYNDVTHRRQNRLRPGSKARVAVPIASSGSSTCTCFLGP
mmetsp:Transcript_20538/g.44731  ORF Transcript_20538/g.44731 Transcript_20538/m.44731 type:complete len:109 (+) Transcript_20538:75-401(+)